MINKKSKLVSFQWYILYDRSTLPSFVTNNTLSTRLGNGTGNGPNMSMNRGLGQHGTSGTNNRSSPNSSSAYSSNLTQQQVWRTQKPDGLGGPFSSGGMGGGSLGARCSWKFVAIFFMLLSVILVSALIYSTGKWTSICIISNQIEFAKFNAKQLY